MFDRSSRMMLLSSVASAFLVVGCSSAPQESTSDASTEPSCHISTDAMLVSVTLVEAIIDGTGQPGLSKSVCPQIHPTPDECTVMVDNATCSGSVNCMTVDGFPIFFAPLRAEKDGSTLTGLEDVDSTTYTTDAGVDYRCRYSAVAK
jgi:hypothetical protein